MVIVSRLRRRLLPLALVTFAFGTLLVGSGEAASSASVVDYSQCANKGAAAGACQSWINGTLNGNNSTYSEDQSIPQRLILSIPAGSTLDQSVEFTYLDRKGTHHAYDSLATWNKTLANADRCQGLSGANCVESPTSTAPDVKADIPDDSTEIPPESNPTWDPSHTNPDDQVKYHMLPPGAGRQVWIYGIGSGGATPVWSAYSHTSPASGDDYASVTMTYYFDPAVYDTDNDSKLDSTQLVMILFGGHLGAGCRTDSTCAGSPRGWGIGVGSSDISGGPYHIRITAIDATSPGNRDNQIQSSAIIPLTLATLGTTPSVSATLNDSASVVGSNPSGTVTFWLYGATGVTTALTNCQGASDTIGSGGLLYKKTITFSSNGSGTRTIATTDSGTLATGSSNVVTAAGTYYWTGTYSGDGANIGATQSCAEHADISLTGTS